MGIFGPTTREIAMQTAQRLDDHVKSCTDASTKVQTALASLTKALEDSVDERHKQYERINGNVIKVLLAIIGAVALAAFTELLTHVKFT